MCGVQWVCIEDEAKATPFPSDIEEGEGKQKKERERGVAYPRG